MNAKKLINNRPKNQLVELIINLPSIDVIGHDCPDPIEGNLV